jgi:hypothetical protein
MTGADAVVAIIPTAAVALLGWMGKNALGRYTDRVDEVNARQKELQQELSAHVDECAAVCPTKVDREDWMREAARMRMTLEELTKGQCRLEGKLDAGTQIAAAIESLKGVSVESLKAAVVESLKREKGQTDGIGG